jgi:hypothetical protein
MPNLTRNIDNKDPYNVLRALSSGINILSCNGTKKTSVADNYDEQEINNIPPSQPPIFVCVVL